ncbi:MAG: hypothetical protein E7Z76_05050 [Methanobrevibacter sp.]|nr:hypothetical protein [Methanobrevibacter sp.]
MNKKVIMVLIICFTAVLAMGSVSAANMVNKNFDGFSIDVPKNVDFKKETNSSANEDFQMDSVMYVSEDLFIIYFDSPMFSQNSSSYFSQLMFEMMNVDLDKCYETQEGNMTILEPTQSDDNHFPVVSVHEGNRMVVISGVDLKLVKEMGKSVEFK